MTTFKKIFACVLALIMLITASSCGKNDPVDNSTTEDIFDENLFDDSDWYGDETTTESTTEISTTKPSTSTTQKAETTTRPTQSTTSTTQKSEDVTQAEKSAVLKSEYSWNSKKQIVYYPADLEANNASYPALVWANGTSCPPSLYDGLLKELAKGGYIVIANEETMAADGTAQRESIDFIIAQNSNEKSIFYNKVKSEKIGAIGHSQGGRSSVNAATADSRIDCVISLAGSNYTSEAEILSTPTLFIAGSSDMIVDAGMWIKPAYKVCTGPAVYASLKGAIHTRCCTNPTDYSGYAISWCDAWLKNDKKAIEIFKDGGTLSKDSKWQDFACKGI